MKKLIFMLPLLFGLAFVTCKDDEELNDPEKEQTTDKDTEQNGSEDNKKDENGDKGEEKPGDNNQESSENDNNTTQQYYMVILSASPVEGGEVAGWGLCESGRDAEIKAIPKDGYKFLKWSDGVTSATRTVTSNGTNISLIAYFEVGNNENNNHETNDPTLNQGVGISGVVGNFDYVDLGLSVNWCTTNVGAFFPYDYGYYFSWGDVNNVDSKVSWEDYKWGDFNAFTKYCLSEYSGDVVDGKNVVEPDDDAATSKMGKAWRTPTFKETQELIDGCDWEEKNNYQGSGVSGILGTSKKNKNFIFLPAAGRFDRDGLSNEYMGYYWSSSLTDHSASAYGIYFFSDNIEINECVRFYAMSIRPVTAKK